MEPQLDKVVWLFNGLRLSNEETLENVCEMTHVEFVVEVECSLTEILFNLAVECEC